MILFIMNLTIYLKNIFDIFILYCPFSFPFYINYTYLLLNLNQIRISFKFNMITYLRFDGRVTKTSCVN